MKSKTTSHPHWQYISLLILSILLLFFVAAVAVSQLTSTLSATHHTMLGRGWMTDVAWSPDGETVAISSSVGVWLFEADKLDADPILLPSDSAPVSSVAWSPDGSFLIEGRWDNRVYQWQMDDLSAPSQVLSGHRGFVNAVAVHSNGKWVASASTDKTARLWDIETGKTLRTFEGHDHSITTLAFNETGDWLATGSRDASVRLWYTSTAQPFGIWEKNVVPVHEVMFTDGYLQILYRDRMQYTVDIATGANVAIIQQSDLSLDSAVARLDTSSLGFHPPINTIEYAPDSSLLAVGTGNIFTPDNQILVWDMESETVLASYTDDMLSHIIALAYQPDSTTLAFGDTGGELILWDYEANKVARRWQAHEGELLSMTFPDTNTLVTGGDDGMLRVWDVTTGDLLNEFESPNGAVHHIVLGEDVRFRQDDTLTTYVISDEEQSLNLLCSHGDTLGAVTFNADNSLRATATFDYTILLTDVATGDIQRTLSGHDNLIGDLAFSSDGRWLASGGWDNTVRLWDVRTGEIIQVLYGHTRPVTAVQFAPDGSQLVSASDDGTVRVWMLKY